MKFSFILILSFCSIKSLRLSAKHVINYCFPSKRFVVLEKNIRKYKTIEIITRRRLTPDEDWITVLKYDIRSNREHWGGDQFEFVIPDFIENESYIRLKITKIGGKQKVSRIMYKNKNGKIYWTKIGCDELVLLWKKALKLAYPFSLV